MQTPHPLAASPRVNSTSRLGLLLTALIGGPALAQEAPPANASNASQQVTVTAKRPDYKIDTATTGTKLDLPLADIPASIQVVSQEVLRDRGVTKIEQIAETVSGVHAESSYGNNGATFFSIRGFTASDSLRDGFRNHGYDAFRDVQSIDHVEVLKGPAGALYGSATSLGGNINILSKRPQKDAFTVLGLTAGSFGQLRPTLDWNRPLNGDASLTARLNLAAERNDTFRDHGGYQSVAISPSLKWDVNADTSVTALLEYDHLDRDRFDLGVPNIPDYKSIPRTRYFGFDTDHGKNDTAAASLIVDHKLDAAWRLREALHYNYALQRSGQTFPDLSSYTGGTVVPYTTFPYVPDEHSYDFDLQNELIGRFATGAIEHNLLIGAELSRNESGNGAVDYFSTSLDIHQPDFQTPWVPIGSGSRGEQVIDNLGLYFQDLIEFTPQWKLMVGLRADRFRSKARSGDTWGSAASETDLSPRAGLVWQPRSGTSVYLSYSKAYAAVVGHHVSGESYRAEKGEQYEAGVKQEVIKDKLTANLAVFDLTRTGILTSDPADPFNQIQTGEQRSRGTEFDLAGDITPSWKVIAAYALTDAKVTQDNALPVGDHLSNVPKHSGSLWTTWQVHGGSFDGLGIGSGVVFVGAREANLPNTYKLDAYWRTDASLFYERAAWRAQLNLFNLFDRHYYTGGQTGVFNYTLDPGKPFSVQATITYRF